MGGAGSAPSPAGDAVDEVPGAAGQPRLQSHLLASRRTSNCPNYGVLVLKLVTNWTFAVPTRLESWHISFTNLLQIEIKEE